MNEIKATLDDVDLLCGYLHDASFTPGGIAMDFQTERFSLDLERICYEKGEKGKALFLIPVIRCPWVASRLTVTGVLKVEEEWIDRKLDGPNDIHVLMDIEKKGNDTLEISSEGLRLRMTISESSQIILEDLSEPSAGRRVTDFARSVFRGMGEIQDLRRRSRKT